MPTWTFNNKINTRHERSLRIIHKGIIYKYINIQSTFQDFLDKGKVGLIHGNTIQTLPTETESNLPVSLSDPKIWETILLISKPLFRQKKGIDLKKYNGALQNLSRAKTK